jgi:hypothetical protein
VKRFSLFAICLFAYCFAADAFPSEEQLKSKLRVGLTADEVCLFGEPNSGRVMPCIDCTFTYLPPLGSLTVPKEGYAGLRIRFTEGKVRDWTIYTGNPSYAQPKVPLSFRGFLWFFGIILALGIIGKVIIRRTPVAAVVSREVAQAFENREIRAEELPPEFRFITHDTKLQEVIDKLGKPSRILKVPINAGRGLGYALVSSNTGNAAIVVYEYDLPYHAAVIVMPEFPFDMQNRIRAVFYRSIQPDFAEATEWCSSGHSRLRAWHLIMLLLKCHPRKNYD